MRTIGQGTLLAAGALGLTLAASGYGAAAGTFAAGRAGEMDLAAAMAYTLVQPDEGAEWVDPATGEPPSGCRTGELRISGRDGALVFENITGHACSLGGHPAVADAAGSFTRIGAAAPAVLLAPGERVSAAIKPCGATVRAPGYQVSAPGDTTTVFVDAPHGACVGGSVGAFRAVG